MFGASRRRRLLIEAAFWVLPEDQQAYLTENHPTILAHCQSLTPALAEKFFQALKTPSPDRDKYLKVITDLADIGLFDKLLDFSVAVEVIADNADSSCFKSAALYWQQFLSIPVDRHLTKRFNLAKHLLQQMAAECKIAGDYSHSACQLFTVLAQESTVAVSEELELDAEFFVELVATGSSFALGILEAMTFLHEAIKADTLSLPDIFLLSAGKRMAGEFLHNLFRPSCLKVLQQAGLSTSTLINMASTAKSNKDIIWSTPGFIVDSLKSTAAQHLLQTPVYQHLLTKLSELAMHNSRDAVMLLRGLCQRLNRELEAMPSQISTAVVIGKGAAATSTSACSLP